jgi:hypothetical protein
MVAMMSKPNFEFFENVLSHTRGFFVLEYHAGTREMIYRYVCAKVGDVPPLMISAALKILRDRGAITFDKKVWWFLSDR